MSTYFTLANVALATTAIYLIHSLVLLPALAKALRQTSIRWVGFWASLVTIADASRLMWMMLALSSLLTWATIAIAGAIGSDTAAATEGAIERLQRVRSAILTMEQGGSVLLLVLGSAALLFWIWRYRTHHVSGAIQQIRAAQAEALVDKLNEGTLPELPPTETMQKLAGVLDALKTEQGEIELKLADTQDEAEQRKLASRLGDLQADFQEALRALVITDIDRRIDVSPLAVLESDVPRPARGLREKLGRAFISRGLLRQLSWGQRGLLLLNLLLSIPTMLVAAQGDIAGQLKAREVKLADMYVSFKGREQAQRLEAAIEAARARPPQTNPQQAANTPQTNPAQITRSANIIAQAFERSIGNSFAKAVQGDDAHILHAPSDADLIRAHADIRAEKARREVLQIVVSDRPGGDIYLDTDPIHPSRFTGTEARNAERVQAIPGLTNSTGNVASALAREDGQPITTIGRAMARQVEEMMTASPDFRDAMMRASASYQEVARPSQIARVLFTEMFSGTSHAATADLLTPEMARWVNDAIDRAVGDRVTSALSNTFRATLMETRDLAVANAALDGVARESLATADFSALRATVAASLPNDTELADLARSRHPGLRQAVDARAAANQRDLTKAVYATRIDPRELAGAQRALDETAARAGAMQSFEDIVPPTVGSAANSDDRALAALRPGPPDSGIPGAGGGGGGGGGGLGGGGGGGGSARPRPGVEARAPVRTASVSSVARGRSFGALRGFARVGGVLIGRDPEDLVTPLDFRNFEWTRDGGTLRFHLVAADGSAVNAGPFHASAVHGALAYAADGRALTATMISAEPLRDLKILLHPALLDTSLGCRAISIDRFADESTGRDQYPERARAEGAFQANVMLYEIARAAIIDALPLTLKPEEVDFRKNTTARAHGLIALTASTPRNEDREVLALLGSEIKVTTAPGLHRFDHFNHDVVDIVEACMGPAKSPQDFVACTRERGGQYVGSGGTRSDYEKIGAATLPVPTFQIWSGVREAPYRPDATLSFLRQPGDSTLQFMVQVAFTSPPYQKLLKEGRTKLEDGDEQSDPYEFSDLKISEKVLTMVMANPEKRDVFDGIVEFTALQRLFRLAFEGRLGSRFPIEKLTVLATATRNDVKRQDTPRWNAKSPELSFLFEAASALPRMSEELKSKTAACLTANGLPASAPPGEFAFASFFDAWKRHPALDSSTWSKLCVFSDTLAPQRTQAGVDTLISLVKFSQQYPATRDLRHSLGVDAADRKDVQACEPM